MLALLWFSALMSAAAPGAQDIMMRWTFAMERDAAL